MYYHIYNLNGVSSVVGLDVDRSWPIVTATQDKIAEEVEKAIVEGHYTEHEIKRLRSLPGTDPTYGLKGVHFVAVEDTVSCESRVLLTCYGLVLDVKKEDPVSVTSLIKEFTDIQDVVIDARVLVRFESEKVNTFDQIGDWGRVIGLDGMLLPDEYELFFGEESIPIEDSRFDELRELVAKQESEEKWHPE